MLTLAFQNLEYSKYCENFNQMKKLLRTDQISLTSCYFQNLKIFEIKILVIIQL